MCGRARKIVAGIRKKRFTKKKWLWWRWGLASSLDCRKFARISLSSTERSWLMRKAPRCATLIGSTLWGRLKITSWIIWSTLLLTVLDSPKKRTSMSRGEPKKSFSRSGAACCSMLSARTKFHSIAGLSMPKSSRNHQLRVLTSGASSLGHLLNPEITKYSFRKWQKFRCLRLARG